jgi:hypothetical protein
MIYLLMTEHALWVFRVTGIIFIRWDYRGGATIFCQCGLRPKSFTKSTEKNNCPKKPRSSRPARQLLVPGYTGDFLEAVSRSDVFQMISGRNTASMFQRFSVFSCRIPRDTVAGTRVCSVKFRVGWAHPWRSYDEIIIILNFVLWTNQLLT